MITITKETLSDILWMSVAALKKKCSELGLSTSKKNKPRLQFDLLKFLSRKKEKKKKKSKKKSKRKSKTSPIPKTIETYNSTLEIIEKSFTEKFGNASYFSFHKELAEEGRLYTYYDDPHFEDEDYFENMSSLLNKKVGNDVSNVILDFVCGDSLISDRLSYVEDPGNPDFTKDGKYLKCGLVTESDDIGTHECSVNCYDKFNKSSYYGFPTHSVAYPRHTTTGSSGSNSEGRLAPLVRGWYGKVIPVDSGNCFHDALFKMRDLIHQHYPQDILKRCWGAINDRERFDRLSKTLPPTMDSLAYFPFLLGTPDVCFINVLGESVYKKMASVETSFYVCMFLIEGTDNPDIGHLSPINFGCLTDNCTPMLMRKPRTKFLFGKDPWQSYDFLKTFHKFAELRYDLRNIDISRDYTNGSIDESLVLEMNSSNEASISHESFRQIKNILLEEKMNEVRLIPEHIVSNSKLHQKNPKIMTFQINENCPILDDNFLEVEFEDEKNTKSKKKSDLIITYPIDEKTNFHKLLWLIEFKTTKNFKLQSIAQVLFYHFKLRTKCRFILISCFLFNIVIEFSPSKKRTNKSIYTIIYNDTECKGQKILDYFGIANVNYEKHLHKFILTKKAIEKSFDKKMMDPTRIFNIMIQFTKDMI